MKICIFYANWSVSFLYLTVVNKPQKAAKLILIYDFLCRICALFAISSLALMIISTFLATLGHCVRGHKMLLASGLYALGGKKINFENNNFAVFFLRMITFFATCKEQISITRMSTMKTRLAKVQRITREWQNFKQTSALQKNQKRKRKATLQKNSKLI